jgi:tryptophan synthase beta chain
MIGSAVGPDPYPQIVKYFQSVIGNEAKEQCLEAEGRLPDYLIACVGGGSNAIGLFAPFYDDKKVKMIGVEPAGRGLDTPDHAATLTLGKPGIIHGFKCKVIQDENGEPAPVYSISAGLDYPGVGPEHCYYQATGRAEYVTATDKEAIDAFLTLSKVEGIIPAIESSHAVAAALRLAPTLDKDKIIVVNLSGRGDKDVAEIARILGRD